MAEVEGGRAQKTGRATGKAVSVLDSIVAYFTTLAGFECYRKLNAL